MEKKRRQTAFETFLKNKGACGEALAFVAEHAGSFARAWKSNTNEAWVQWLREQFAPCNYRYGSDKCPGCKMGEKSVAAQRRFVLAQARRKGWIK